MLPYLQTRNSEFATQTKLKIHNTIVRPIVTYGSGIWTMDEHKLLKEKFFGQNKKIS